MPIETLRRDGPTLRFQVETSWALAWEVSEVNLWEAWFATVWVESLGNRPPRFLRCSLHDHEYNVNRLEDHRVNEVAEGREKRCFVTKRLLGPPLRSALVPSANSASACAVDPGAGRRTICWEGAVSADLA